MNKLFLFFLILAIAIGGAGFWYYQQNFYSKETVKLEILSVDSADLAEEVEYIVKYKNNGNVRVEEPELIFEYPENSIVEDNKQREILDSEDLGEAIYPGEEKTFKFRARLLGKEGDAKKAKAWLSYIPKNLQAKYESATTFTTVIEKVPLTFEFDFPSKVEAGKESKFRLNYFSNIDYPIPGLRVKMIYPSGFEFVYSKPKGIEKTEWDIGALSKAQGGKIEVFGKIFGEPNERKLLQAELGIWQNGEFVLLKQIFQGIEIVEPSLFISQQINGNPEYVADPGSLLHYEIFFKNIGQDLLTDLFLVVKLQGNAYNLQTLRSNTGSFEIGDNSIIFDSRKVSELKFLDAQEEGTVEFWIELKDRWNIDRGQDRNLVVKDKIILSQAHQEFETKINTVLEFAQKGYFQEEIFGNTGPVPPKSNEPTTYTIMWQVGDYYNDTENVKVKAILPAQVELTGEIFPEEQKEKFAFDSISREIVWDVGDLLTDQASLNSVSKPSIAFQVAFTPNEEQRGTIPDIISEAEIIGEDIWTEQLLSIKSPAINTSLPDDESVSEGQGIVQ
jgi:hypothetical protein